MVIVKNLADRDLKHVWHPSSQMKDYELFKPLIVKKARGSYIELTDGRQIIDAISSWWCKSLGHNHPQLKQALYQQVEQFEQVILANTTHETLVEFSEKLTGLTQTLDKIFFACDGACTVEIAMKMSLQAQQIQGNTKRNKFIALSKGYHGDTLAAMSVSDIGLFRNQFTSHLLDVSFIKNIPYLLNTADPLWADCEPAWQQIQAQLAPYCDSAAALIVEPIVQGAGGMQIYSQDFLRRLRHWTQANNIFLIADEIMTGIGRTGMMFACQHAQIEPDFLCLSKGLTSGWLPLSVVLTTTAIYAAFYDDFETGKSFLHSHTFGGNALAVRLGLETLKIMEAENIIEQVQKKEQLLGNLMQQVASNTGKLTNIRHIGAIVAADLIVADPSQRVGYQVYKKATELGALLRPIGNTIYWLAPLNTDEATLHRLQQITEAAIKAVLG